MIDNERELTGALERLEIDTQPRAAHRAELRQRMLAAFEPLAEQDRPVGPAWVDWLRGRIMNRTFARAAAAVVVAAAVISVVAFWPGPDGGGGIALAEVRQRFEKARTICYRESYYRDGQLERSAEVKWKEPGLARSESLGMIAIFDGTKGEFLTLATKSMTAHSGKITDMKNYYHSDWLEKLRKIVGSEWAEEVPGKEIAGRKVKGWRVGKSGDSATVWADARTGELLEVEFISANARVVMSEFEYGKELDDALFDLTPPKDYRHHTRAEFKSTDPSAKDLVLLLRIWAMGNDGVFPDKLDGWKFPAAAEKVPDEQVGIFTKEQLKAGEQSISRAFAILYGWAHEWSYVGKGVRLGEEDKPVFWYRPKKSKTYHVIYGDLSVKDVRPEDLPKAPPKRAETRPAVESD